MGLLASLVTAFVLQVVVDQFRNELYPAILTAGIMLMASCILTYMAIWMHKQARAHAKRRLEGHIGAGNVIGVAMLAFVSVLREGIETVLFLSALAYTGESLSIVGGLAGLVLAILLVWLLIIIAAGLLGSAINMLQGAGIVPGSTTPIFDISGILPDTTGVGVFLRGLFGYNASPTAAQLALWAVYLAIAVLFWWRGHAGRA
jgi:high-affinity iron transporter